MAEFTGKKILILGGSRGIGEAIVRRFATGGGQVAFTYAGSTAGVAVVADSYWRAQQAVQALQVEWVAGPNATLDSDRVDESLRQAVVRQEGYRFHERGNVDRPLPAVREHDADEARPALEHRRHLLDDGARAPLLVVGVEDPVAEPEIETRGHHGSV